MKLKTTVVLCLLLSLVPVQAIQAQKSTSAAESRKLNKMFADYYEEHLRLFPLTATAIADPRYNDQFPNPISEEHRARQRALYAEISKSPRAV